RVLDRERVHAQRRADVLHLLVRGVVHPDPQEVVAAQGREDLVEPVRVVVGVAPHPVDVDGTVDHHLLIVAFGLPIGSTTCRVGRARRSPASWTPDSAPDPSSGCTTPPAPRSSRPSRKAPPGSTSAASRRTTRRTWA